jgi:hypothetical protein
VATRSRDGDPDDAGGDDPAVERSVAKSTLFDRLRTGPQAQRPASTASPRAVKRVIERLDDRERWICFAASALAVLTGVLIYVVETENKNFRLRKGELTPQTSLVIGLITGVLLLVSTLIGRRAPVGFVSLFVFLAFGTQYFAGIPFLVLAVWLLYRSYKYQKEAAANRRAAMADGPTPTSPPRGRGSAARTAPSARTAPRGATGSAKRGPATPEANKRFTPKRPPPPPPKPSRKDRKAAQASE